MKKGLTSFQRPTMGTSPKLVWRYVIPLKLVKQPFSAATQHLTKHFWYPSFNAPSFSWPRSCLQGQAHSHKTSWVPPATAPFHEMCNILEVGANLGSTAGTWTFPDHPLAKTLLWNYSAAWFCFQIKGDSSQVEQHDHQQACSQCNPAPKTPLLVSASISAPGDNDFGWQEFPEGGLLTLWCV